MDDLAIYRHPEEPVIPKNPVAKVIRRFLIPFTLFTAVFPFLPIEVPEGNEWILSATAVGYVLFTVAMWVRLSRYCKAYENFHRQAHLYGVENAIEPVHGKYIRVGRFLAECSQMVMLGSIAVAVLLLVICIATLGWGFLAIFAHKLLHGFLPGVFYEPMTF